MMRAPYSADAAHQEARTDIPQAKNESKSHSIRLFISKYLGENRSGLFNYQEEPANDRQKPL